MAGPLNLKAAADLFEVHPRQIESDVLIVAAHQLIGHLLMRRSGAYAMRAIAINSAAQSVEITAVSSDLGATAKWFGSRPHKAARFPNGDILLAVTANVAEAFTVGGSAPIAGSALLIGRRNKFGEYAAARTSVDVLQSLITWTMIQINSDPHGYTQPGVGGRVRNTRKKAAVL
ncbi:hypothetical protein FIU28_17085 [Tardiphaga sp. vice154]|uniref:hypothetical protein n=1 Tax=Tardiphaga sp. vice154 TaxID=2592814 RepID=UPI0011633E95|nr:hypothetical protein [Tardiphaga sp. vice154]QDM22674.1 hypothetical protein FIU28_17085 [Tardiphaga sp. vice154]